MIAVFRVNPLTVESNLGLAFVALGLLVGISVVVGVLTGNKHVWAIVRYGAPALLLCGVALAVLDRFGLR